MSKNRIKRGTKRPANDFETIRFRTKKNFDRTQRTLDQTSFFGTHRTQGQNIKDQSATVNSPAETSTSYLSNSDSNGDKLTETDGNSEESAQTEAHQEDQHPEENQHVEDQHDAENEEIESFENEKNLADENEEIELLESEEDSADENEDFISDTLPKESFLNQYFDSIQERLKEDNRVLGKPAEYVRGTFWIEPMLPFFALKNKMDLTELYKPRVFLWAPHHLTANGLQDLRCPKVKSNGEKCNAKLSTKGYNKNPYARRIVDLTE